MCRSTRHIAIDCPTHFQEIKGNIKRLLIKLSGAKAPAEPKPLSPSNESQDILSPMKHRHNSFLLREQQELDNPGNYYGEHSIIKLKPLPMMTPRKGGEMEVECASSDSEGGATRLNLHQPHKRQKLQLEEIKELESDIHQSNYQPGRHVSNIKSSHHTSTLYHVLDKHSTHMGTPNSKFYCKLWPSPSIRKHLEYPQCNLP